jgi:hypothetical protein
VLDTGGAKDYISSRIFKRLNINVSLEAVHENRQEKLQKERYIHAPVLFYMDIDSLRS